MTDPLHPPLTDDDHIRGPRNAPFELVMYGSFDCQYTHAAQTIVRSVRVQLEGKLRYAFRHFVMPGRHRNGQAAAEASEAAAARGLFWEFHDVLFDNFGHLEPEELYEHAAYMGLPFADMRRELEEHKWAPRVGRDVRSGEASGVRSTPAFFVNGARHDGNYDAAALARALIA